MQLSIKVKKTQLTFLATLKEEGDKANGEKLPFETANILNEFKDLMTL